MNKKYWLRGLSTGIVIYIFAILLVSISGGLFTGSVNYGVLLGITTAMLGWPVIVAGLIIGLIYGLIKKRDVMVRQ